MTISTEEIVNAIRNTKQESDAIEIFQLGKYFSSKPPPDLFPTAYHTLSYEKELKNYNKLKKLVEKYNKEI